MILSLIAILVLLIFLSFVWPPDSPWSPWWRTNKKIAKAVCRLANISKDDIVYELGSGDGEFILTCAKEFKAKKSVGIEIEFTRFFMSEIRRRISKIENAEFRREDFKKVRLKDATVVYFYLVPAVIKRIMPKLRKELKPGTRLISYRYEMPLNLTVADSKNQLYLYVI